MVESAIISLKTGADMAKKNPNTKLTFNFGANRKPPKKAAPRNQGKRRGKNITFGS
jgi:hypothetical protein